MPVEVFTAVAAAVAAAAAAVSTKWWNPNEQFQYLPAGERQKLAREWWLSGNRKNFLKFQHLLTVWLWASHLTSPSKFSYLWIGDFSSAFFHKSWWSWNIFVKYYELQCSLNAKLRLLLFYSTIVFVEMFPDLLPKPGILSFYPFCCPVWLLTDDWSPVLVGGTSGHLSLNWELPR